mgnify:CR=1 FL=1
MAHLNFDENYNNKLFCNYLTTFRSTESIEEKGLKVGDSVELHLNHIPFAVAIIETMDSYNIQDFKHSIPWLLRILLTLDVSPLDASPAAA